VVVGQVNAGGGGKQLAPVEEGKDARAPVIEGQDRGAGGGKA
jgi:hypothetical protein